MKQYTDDVINTRQFGNNETGNIGMTHIAPAVAAIEDSDDEEEENIQLDQSVDLDEEQQNIMPPTVPKETEPIIPTTEDDGEYVENVVPNEDEEYEYYYEE